MTEAGNSRPGPREAPSWRRAAIAAVAAVVALSPVGIGGAPAGADAGAQASRAARVSISSIAFMPKVLHVRRGTTVTFANTSRTTHTATRRGSFDTGVIRPGRSATLRFRRKGSFAYFCRVHPFMHGKIVVG